MTGTEWWKHRGTNWRQIAEEFQSERDALRGDVLRMQEARDELQIAFNNTFERCRDIAKERDDARADYNLALSVIRSLRDALVHETGTGEYWDLVDAADSLLGRD